VAVLGALVLLPLLTAGTTSGIALEAAREVGAQAGAQTALEMLRDIPMLNSGGDHVYAEMYVNDVTGVVTTPTDGGIFTVVEDAPLTAGETDGSGCITAAISTGLFTIAARCGVGEVKITACVTDFQGGNTAYVDVGAVAKNGTALTTANQLREVEAVDAGARGNIGCIETVQNAVLADTFGLYFKTDGATAEAVTTRGAAIRIEKILNK
jgi:hypothetical protein